MDYSPNPKHQIIPPEFPSSPHFGRDGRKCPFRLKSHFCILNISFLHTSPFYLCWNSTSLLKIISNIIPLRIILGEINYCFVNSVSRALLLFYSDNSFCFRIQFTVHVRDMLKVFESKLLGATIISMSVPCTWYILNNVAWLNEHINKGTIQEDFNSQFLSFCI